MRIDGADSRAARPPPHATWWAFENEGGLRILVAHGLEHLCLGGDSRPLIPLLMAQMCLRLRRVRTAQHPVAAVSGRVPCAVSQVRVACLLPSARSAHTFRLMFRSAHGAFVEGAVTKWMSGFWNGVTAVSVALLYTAAWVPLPGVHNEYLALPISRELAFPGSYASSDLIVSSGARAPFHVYHAAQLLYTWGADVDLWWLGLLAASLVFLYWSVWRLARSLAVDARAAVCAPLLLVVVRAHHLTIHDSSMPLWSFISASVALPLAFCALADAIDERWRRAAALAGGAFLFHPGLSVVTMAACAAVMFGRSVRPALRTFAHAALIWLVVAAPNVAYILLQSGGNVGGLDDPLVARIFRDVTQHAFAVGYRAGGYGGVAIASALGWHAAASLAGRPREAARAAIVALLLTAVGYSAVVAVWPEPAIVQFYALRSLWLLKPLVLTILFATSLDWIAQHGNRSWMPWLASGAFLAGLAHPNPAVTDGCLLVGAGIAVMAFALTVRGQIAGVLIATAGLSFLIAWVVWMDGNPILASAVGLWRNVTMMAVAAVIAWEGRYEALAGGGGGRLWWPSAALLAGAGVLIGLPPGRAWLPQNPRSIVERGRFSAPRGPFAGLIRWVRDSTPPGSVIAVPPLDQNLDFLSLRHVAVRSVFVNASDLAQLTYDVSSFRIGAKRMLLMGVRPGPQSRGLSDDAYSRFDDDVAAALAKSGVAYAVIRSDASPRWIGRLPLPFRDPRWSVIDLRPLGDRAQRGPPGGP